MSQIKNGGLDQYGAEPFERQQFGTAGVEWVKILHHYIARNVMCYDRLSSVCNSLFTLPTRTRQDSFVLSVSAV